MLGAVYHVRYTAAMHPTWCMTNGALNHVRFRAATNPTWFVAEREGFEPSVPFLVGTHDFQSCPFGLSGISPFLYAMRIAPSA